MKSWWFHRVAVGALLLIPAHGFAQSTTGQVWANFTVDSVISRRLMLEVDFEPKVQVSAPPGDPGWSNLDLTSTMAFAPAHWVDLVGELLIGHTQQTDDLETSELTGRAGVRFHFMSRLEQAVLNERIPKRRLVIQDLFRVEWRNVFYSNEQPTDSLLRLRNRFQVQFPFNRPKVSDAGALYLVADWESFYRVSDPTERFANRQRIRVGLGFRQSTAWRYATLYQWDRSRNTTSEPFTTTDNTLNVQIKRVWQ